MKLRNTSPRYRRALDTRRVSDRSQGVRRSTSAEFPILFALGREFLIAAEIVEVVHSLCRQWYQRNYGEMNADSAPPTWRIDGVRLDANGQVFEIGRIFMLSMSANHHPLKENGIA